jgi:uncharacterized coiled-coil DUF342 family protein
MSSNRATTELNKLLSELEEARNRFDRLLPQVVNAQAEMERCETKVKQFYMANGPGVVSNQEEKRNAQKTQEGKKRAGNSK